ncbi:MAG: FIG00495827: hypothetical protein [uncultured Campylobacterales bacterium]|uniref:Helicase HerA central domain-containing protein n=1 Tax=uncultured Campylobacterales bacterium TaxID=352960 RepID=A0A6S6SF73_9BACT|nr:MAG: FIG00495827: hypothetical protein [uncultured Campylobacterales bacterium]
MDYEKLGYMYLGKKVIDDKQGLKYLYKNKNLTTHGLIIGMTGSGKTGLGINLIEEATMDNVPSIIIDPKGDMGNLLLNFPDQDPSDYAQYIDEDEATQKSMSKDEYAKKIASMYQEGIKDWDQDKSRIKTLGNKADFNIFTPGSNTGIPINILGSFDVPSDEVLSDPDMLNMNISSLSSSVLSLAKIDTNSSKENILLSNIFLHSFKQKKSLTLTELITSIINPPMKKIGIFGIDDFYPADKRMDFAMKLNNILADPSFANWITGFDFDIDKILYTPELKPRTSVFSISHLNDNERMFFVTLLLNKFISWMRKQEGSSSLKVLLYMDEIFGFFPPTKNPPSKEPMMLLLKQARAYGVGVVLSTQNPVDLDYKGLSNIGSWFIGRLQTNQDKERIIDNLITGPNDDKEELMTLISSLKSRRFLLKDTRVDKPFLFDTKWVLSYLKGPMSRSDIKKLMDPKKELLQINEKKDVHKNEVTNIANQKPLVSKDIKELFCYSYSEDLLFEPYIVAEAVINISKRDINKQFKVSHKIYIDDSIVDFSFSNQSLNDEELEYSLKYPQKSSFANLPEVASKLKNLKSVKKKFVSYLYNTTRIEIYEIPKLKLYSNLDESMFDFKLRIKDALNSKKDAEVQKIKNSFDIKLHRLESRLDKYAYKLEKEKQDVSAKKSDTILAVGLSVLGAIFGSKSSAASKVATSIRKAGRIKKEKNDVASTEVQIQNIQDEIDKISMIHESKIDDLDIKYSDENYEIKSTYIKPKKSDIYDTDVALVWIG